MKTHYFFNQCTSSTPEQNNRSLASDISPLSDDDPAWEEFRCIFKEPEDNELTEHPSCSTLGMARAFVLEAQGILNPGCDFVDESIASEISMEFRR